MHQSFELSSSRLFFTILFVTRIFLSLFLSGEGDTGDVWSVVCDGDYWQRDQAVMIKHRDTGETAFKELFYYSVLQTLISSLNLFSVSFFLQEFSWVLLDTLLGAPSTDKWKSWESQFQMCPPSKSLLYRLSFYLNQLPRLSKLPSVSSMSTFCLQISGHLAHN